MPEEKQLLKKLKDEAVYLAYAGLAGAIRMVPEGLAYLGAELGARLMRRFLKDREQNYLKNLERVAPELTEEEKQLYVKKAFSSYARYWVDAALCATFTKEELDRRFLPKNHEWIFEALSSGRGVVLALAHLGSFEPGGMWLAAHGYPMWTVAERLSPEKLFDFFVKERERIGIKVLPLSPSVISTLSKVLRNGGLVGLLCDRDITGTGIEVNFFSGRARLPVGPALLAIRTGALLVPVGLYTAGNGSYEAVVLDEVPYDRRAPLREELLKVTQELASRLEVLIKKHPEQWHMFQPVFVEGPDR